MAKPSDREAWVEAQAEALMADLHAKEAAAKDQSTTVVEGTRYGQTGGTHHGDQTWSF
ncbi:hypothetical protein ACH49M_32645 [Rhodococcus qingshengii]|uniref:hypothetical protein n=1 Tax=Actinomycetes TaxID=1760 RepID=UPI0033CAC5F6